jgi:N-acetyl-alpha-D-muramate 1-phosphate uridylyltransferase
LRIEAFAPGLPKALVPILGEPFVFHQLRLLEAQGVRDVVYVIGFRGEQIRAAVGDGEAFGLAVSYVDEGTDLHGTGGALRFAHDEARLESTFGVMYGDSYLPVDLGAVWAAFDSTQFPALMTVFRNENRWDRSNVVFEDGRVTLYDKRVEFSDPQMHWIDYGLSFVRRDVVDAVPSGSTCDLADIYRDLSVTGELAGFEVSMRFFEVGSPEGVAALERHLESSA